VKVDVQVHRAAEALDEGDGAGARGVFLKMGGGDQVRGETPIHHAQDLAQDATLDRTEQTQRNRQRQYPLAQWQRLQHLIVTDNSLITGLNLTVGTPVTLTNFLTISSTDTAGSFFGTLKTDSISENFAFTQPGNGTGSLSGPGSEDLFTFFGSVTGDGGLVTWNNPLLINFTDGAELQISLDNSVFACSVFFGQTCTGNETTSIDAHVDLLTGVSSSTVPEPGTLAILAAGLGFLALALGRRRRLSKLRI
jgi:PEP-CTERM motif